MAEGEVSALGTRKRFIAGKEILFDKEGFFLDPEIGARRPPLFCLVKWE